MDKKIVKLLDGYSENDKNKIKKAYDFASKAHDGTYRDTGEPYIIHPLTVALSVKDFGLDVTSIQAALLHDVVEDTNITLKNIRDIFGAEVGKIVNGLTKVKNIKYSKKEKQQAETYRKIILATTRDVRIIIIKLFDRKDNMKTVHIFEKDRAKRYAEETLNVYAPIAHRLGMSKIKTELEDMSFEVLSPRQYKETKNILDQKVKESKKILQDAEHDLKQKLKELSIHEKISIHSRSKSIFSLHEKLESGRNLQEIYDLLGIRVITRNKNTCYVILGAIHSIWKPVPGRFFDYIANPKLNNYQSLHTTVINNNGDIFEIQIRTEEMHQIAEYGIAAHWHYKETGRNPSAYTKDWVDSFNKKTGFLMEPQEIMNAIRDENFQDEIHVFTPEGNLKLLPKGSTPVDFAYAIHSEVGDRCIGARVNNKMVALNYVLQEGDKVEIMQSKNVNATPNQDWLNFVLTNRAKIRIKKANQKNNINPKIKLGKEIFLKLLKDDKLPENLINSPIITYLAQELHLATNDDFFKRLGNKTLDLNEVKEKLLLILAQRKSTNYFKLKSKNKKPELNGVIIYENESNIVTNFARCCTPLPGDKIKGYVSIGRGIVVHKSDCNNLKLLPKERIVTIAWNEKESIRQVYVTEIKLKAWDKPGLLEGLTALISEHGFNIQNVNMSTKDEIVTGSIKIEIDNSESFKKLIDKMNNIDGIIYIGR